MMNPIKYNPMGLKDRSINGMCDIAAKLLYEGFCLEQKRGDCGRLFLEWTKERFWGMVIYDNIPMFLRLWKVLRKFKHVSRDTAICYGDDDVSAWAELTPKGEKLLILDDHVTCADDNVTIYSYYSLDEMKDIGKDYTVFKCITAWPDEVMAYEKPTWNDYRDIKYPSLETHRKNDFSLGCEDGRDKWFSFKLETFMGLRAKDAYAVEGRLSWGLEKLRFAHDGVGYELQDKLK